MFEYNIKYFILCWKYRFDASYYYLELTKYLRIMFVSNTPTVQWFSVSCSIQRRMKALTIKENYINHKTVFSGLEIKWNESIQWWWWTHQSFLVHDYYDSPSCAIFCICYNIWWARVFYWCSREKTLTFGDGRSLAYDLKFDPS